MRISDWSSDVCSSDLRAKLFGCIYASARPGQKILVIAFEARHTYFGHVSGANGHRGRRFPQDTEPPAHSECVAPSVIWQLGGSSGCRHDDAPRPEEFVDQSDSGTDRKIIANLVGDGRGDPGLNEIGALLGEAMVRHERPGRKSGGEGKR